MRKIFVLASIAIAVIMAAIAFAAGPFTVALTSGTGGTFIALVDSLSPVYPQAPALYFPDADVTVSYWNYQTTGARSWYRVYTNDYSDSVSTIPAGLIERPDADFKAVWITRTGATSGVVKWFR